MSELTLPVPVTDLRRRTALARQCIDDLLTHRLGAVTLSYDFYREWNGGWRVRVAISGAQRGQMDFALLQTPQGGLLALPRPLPERWRTTLGIPASDGSVWTLTDQGQLAPFAPPGAANSA